MTTHKEIYEFLKNEHFPPLDKWKRLDPAGESFFSKHPEYPDHPCEKVLLCVTSSCEMEKYAEKNNYDLIISHHPIKCHYLTSMYFHSSMDFAKGMSQNIYFAKAMNLQNINMIGDSYAYGELSNKMSFEEFHNYLNDHGYKTKKTGFQFHKNDDLIKTICFVGGLGSFAFTNSWIGTDRPTLHDVHADIFVTGQLFEIPLKHHFNHILEIGHTNSEKPIFNWVKEILNQKYPQLVVDIADDKLEGWGDT